MAVVNEKKKIQETVVQPAAKTVQTTQKVQPISAGKVADGKQQGYKKINPYAGLTGVSANTAQQIAQAQQGYQSPYSGMINSILQQITNPQEFKYEFNKDNLFNAYKDMYTQQGRQASLDAQGQAAGLTGGYGNSYGAAVGNQAYQQWLTQLYDKGLEFYDRARQRYNDDWNQLLGQYDVLNGQDQQGYQQWLNNLNYWTGLGQNEHQGYMNDQQLAIQQAQLQIQQEQWAAEQAAAAAAAAAAEAAASGGGPGGSSGNGSQYIDVGGGKMAYQDQYGQWHTTDASNVNVGDNDYVMPYQTALSNTISNLASAASGIGNIASTAANHAQNTLSNIGNWLGLGKKKKND